MEVDVVSVCVCGIDLPSVNLLVTSVKPGVQGKNHVFFHSVTADGNAFQCFVS